MTSTRSDTEKREFLKLLFIKYFDPLVQNAQKYVTVFDDAEEIVQDVFVKVWNELDHLYGDPGIKGYLYTSVYNSCMNFLRHKNVIQKYKAKKEHDVSPYTEDNIYEIEKDEIKKAVDDAINLLPEKWREVFIMSRFEGLKYNEIADKLGISIKTVEKYISKSLLFLKEKLKNFIPFLILFNLL